MDKHFFKDLKIVELASILAAPAASSFFSELGANVTKIENIKTGGDPIRQWKNSVEDKNKAYSSYYCSVNYNKNVLFLDIQSDEAQRKIYELVAEADVFITNLHEQKLKKLSFDFDTLSEINHGLIYAQLHAYSRNDDRLGYDMVMQAECGYLSMTGQENQLAKIPVPIADLSASHQLKEGILLALLERIKTGKGYRVEVSLYDSAISSLSYQASNYLNDGLIAKPLGTAHPNIAPYGDLYQTKDDKMIMLAIGSDAQFGKLKKIINFDDVNDFAINQSRLTDRGKLNTHLSASIKKFYLKELELMFNENGIPYAKVNDIGECLTHDDSKTMILNGIVDGEDVLQLSNIAFNIT